MTRTARRSGVWSRWRYRHGLLVALVTLPMGLARGQTIPARLDDKTFWHMVTEMSEPGGFFRSDNFVSNETAFQTVIPRLQEFIPPGSVYVGVGPDQNFTYITSLRPAIAFVVDIRRQNMLQHLLYKAMIEIAPDRAQFLSMLFSRPRPADVDSTTTAEAMLLAYQRVPADSIGFDKLHATLVDRLTKTHGFVLTPEDLAAMKYVHTAFMVGGPDLTYSFGRGPYGMYGRRAMPTYAELMVATDSGGVARSYLASEANFRTLKDLEVRNLIVPITGDFAGDKAVRAVGQWVREHQATVAVFYTSNVEQYLFQTPDAWSRYYASVGTMPLAGNSVFIRAVFGYGGNFNTGPPFGMRSATLLLPIQDLLKAVGEGRIQSYFDVIQLSREFTERGSS
ncbi:MAG: hypothetical protein U0132_21720 [Gemmatimonadaceae bacterium]